MTFAKLLVLLSLCYITSGAIIGSGYLEINQSVPARCYNMPSNSLCPSFDHQIVGQNNAPDKLFQYSLQVVKIKLASMPFFNHSHDCMHCVREYACSNNLMKCTPDNQSPFGFRLAFDVNRTETACANIKRVCPQDVQDVITFNCSVIQRDPFEYSYCIKSPVVAGDICPASNYMVYYIIHS